MNTHQVLLVVLMLSHSMISANPIALAEVAPKVARNLAAGSIATVEVVDGKPVYAIAGQHEPVDVPPEKILFEIGSITKVFTALLLAQAVIEKQVTLNTTVRELVGGKLKFADARVGAITLRQLITHVSGLPRMPDNFEPKNKKDPYASYDRAKLDAYLARAKLPDAKDIEALDCSAICCRANTTRHGKTWCGKESPDRSG
jgi:CubicO group peptidase (beta-lactamase class C family)